jgi:hypothetical protein
MNWNRQLGLALALFTLGTLAYWLEYKHKPDKENLEEQGKKIFQIKDQPVESISITDGKKKLALSCSDLGKNLCKPGENSKWEITEPTKMKADSSNVNALLSTLNTLSPNETIELKDEKAEKKAALLKEYGVDADSRKSSRNVQVMTPKGGSVLYLGNTHPIGETIFAVEEEIDAGQKPTGKVNENHVYLVPSFFKANFEHDLNYWRDKKILTLGAHEIESFDLAGSKERISGEKKEGKWTLHSAKDELPGDSENINHFLNSVSSLTARGFAADNKPGNKNDARARSTLKGTKRVLTLTLKKEQGSDKEAPAPVTLQLYQTPSKVYATVSNLDPVFELDTSTVQRLDKSVKDLRLTKLLTSMDLFSVKRFEFNGTVLIQEKGKWVKEGDKTPVSQEKVQTTLDRLSGNRIKEFRDAKAAPQNDKESVKLVLGDEKNPSKKEFLFWKKDSKLYAKDLQSKRNEVYLIDWTLQDQLPWNQDFYKMPEPKAEKSPDAPHQNQQKK